MHTQPSRASRARACVKAVVLAAFCALTLAAPASARAPKKEAVTPALAVETARLMKSPDAVAPGNPEGLISISPDRKRYVMRVVKGDVKANATTIEVLTGELASLDAAAKPVSVAKLFTTGKGIGGAVFGPVHDVDEMGSPIRWLDNERIIFLSSDKNGARQIVCVNVVTRATEYLTEHPTNVVAYDIAANGSIFYNAQAAPRPQDLEAVLQSGYTVAAKTDASTLFRRDVSGADIFDNAWGTQFFVRDGATKAVRQFKLLGRESELHFAHRINWSPDGRLAMINATADTVPADWSLYKEREMKSRIALARRDLRDATARSVHRLFVIDVATGKTRPLWGAVNLLYIPTVVWSADSRFALLAPTFLPPKDDDSDTLGGSAAAIVEVASGRYGRLPIKIGGPLRVAGMRWVDAEHVEIDARVGANLLTHRFAKTGKTWAFDGEPKPLAPVTTIRMEMRQDLNTPPKLFAVDGGGQERMVLDFNPSLTDKLALGRAEKVEGKLASGIPWSGLLFYPPDYDAKKRYPLLIQSVYGLRVDNTFTLYGLQGGGGLGPTPVATYPGRALASRGVMVLQMDVMMGQKFGTTEEGALRQQGFEAAVAHLDGLKLIDPAKVGLAGFSRNGFYVEYTLTHSSFPFAAAIAADSWDPSYFQSTLTASYGSTVGTIGQEPFGAGLAPWLEKSPGFGTERIMTPLMLIDQSAGMFGVFLKWETFNRLRYLRKPVEFYVMPDAEAHGSHNTQNPAQILALMQRSIDWFDFWLNGREDSDAAKAGQYAGWRKLREQQRETQKHARPPLLEWKATSKPGTAESPVLH